jgi:hypothetical protein
VRIIRTILRSWKRYQAHPNPRIRARFAHEAANLPVRYAGVLWATRRWYQHDPRRVSQIDELLDELYEMYGDRARRAAPRAGRYLLRRLQQQENMLQQGWTYEPPTFYEANFDPCPPGAVRVEGLLVNRIPETRDCDAQEVASEAVTA